ncbi:DUF4238 domain-containing protein [Streptomyces sp. NPDC127036]|uniref:DUF4238 domain-containing protein n=1 Tax=Streptomyces sp. NPDC127036 TaxID=3347112 RepID=UPI003665EEAC
MRRDGELRCRSHSWNLANVKNVAAETGFYTITDENGMPSTVIEHELSGLEGQGLAALRRIDETGMPPAVGTDDRELLCLYLAVQMARTPRQRTMLLFARDVTAYADGREVDQALRVPHPQASRSPAAGSRSPGCLGFLPGHASDEWRQRPHPRRSGCCAAQLCPSVHPAVPCSALET